MSELAPNILPWKTKTMITALTNSVAGVNGWADTNNTSQQVWTAFLNFICHVVHCISLMHLKKGRGTTMQTWPKVTENTSLEEKVTGEVGEQKCLLCIPGLVFGTKLPLNIY